MKRLKLVNLAVVALSLAFAVSSGGNVLAQHGSGSDDNQPTTGQTQTEPEHVNSTEVQHSGSGSSGSGRTATRTVVRSETEAEHGTEVENHDAADDNPHADFRAKGAALVIELRKNHKEQTPEQRQKKCQSRKQGLANKFNRIVTNSQRVQSRFDGILDQAVAYQQANNVQVTDFDSLVTAAQTAKTNSAASITALQGVKPTIDCNNVSVAEDVATFKAAAQTTRDNLKAYRTAVKAVLHALAEAKATTTTTDDNTGGTQ